MTFGYKKIYSTLILIYLFNFYFASDGFGQGNISLSASVDKTTITIGDIITYSVSVTRDEDVSVELPSLGGNLGQFEIRDYNIHEPEKKDGKIIDRVDYTISTFEVGEFEIPPVGVRYFIPPDSTEQTLKTEVINITVESVKPSEEGDIKDIKPPWEILFNWGPIIIGGSIALIVILLIIGLIIYLRKRKKGESFLPKKIEIPRPPHEIAYEELKSLQNSDVLEQGQIKLYYSEISEIIRKYIEGRFQIIALELTTMELMIELNTSDLSSEHASLFEMFFTDCDLVKFAKFIPADEENNEIMKSAIRIVDETKWVDELGLELPEKTTEDEVKVVDLDQMKNDENQQPEVAIVTEEEPPSDLNKENN